MKRVLVFSIFVLVICGSCFGQNAKRDALDGTTWKATDDWDSEYVLIFNSPNCTLSTEGDVRNEGSYSISGINVEVAFKNLENGRVTVFTGTLAGNTMSLESGGYALIFTKQ